MLGHSSNKSQHPRDAKLQLELNQKLRSAVRERNVEEVRKLLIHGVDITYLPDPDADPAYIIALKDRHFEILRLLLTFGKGRAFIGLDELRRGIQGSWGTYGGYEYDNEIVNLLLDYNPKAIHTRSDEGETPLFWALMLQGEEIVKVVDTLINRGAEIDCTNQNGDTPLIYSIRFPNLQTKSLLLERKANINHQNHKGDTALHVACRNGVVETAQLLLSFEANPTIRNKKGETALDIAKLKTRSKDIEEGRAEIVKLITKELRRKSTLELFFLGESKSQNRVKRLLKSLTGGYEKPIVTLPREIVKIIESYANLEEIKEGVQTPIVGFPQNPTQKKVSREEKNESKEQQSFIDKISDQFSTGLISQLKKNPKAIKKQIAHTTFSDDVKLNRNKQAALTNIIDDIINTTNQIEEQQSLDHTISFLHALVARINTTRTVLMEDESSLTENTEAIKWDNALIQITSCLNNAIEKTYEVLRKSEETSTKIIIAKVPSSIASGAKSETTVPQDAFFKVTPPPQQVKKKEDKEIDRNQKLEI